MKNYLIIGLISIVMASCTNAHLEEQKKIDALLVYLDSGKMLLQKVDTGEVYRRIKQIDRHLQLIIKQADSLDKEDAFVIDDYQNCNKYYSKWAVKFPILYDEIETVPMQLQNLKKDISKNLLSEEQVQEYLMTEADAANALVETAVEMSNRLVLLNETFLRTEEKILLLIQSLDSNKVEPKES